MISLFIFYAIMFYLQMNKYPLLKEEVDKICMSHVRRAEYSTKDQVPELDI